MKTTSLTETWKTLDTYGIGASPTVPIFYEGRGNQGAQGHVYPYPLQDKLTADKAPRKWRCVVMENEYVRYEILPDLGGRIVRALDKTNNYDFFYRQDVVKPALIGVLGAWMSGGVEWNFPHHHRTTTFMPADYRIERGADGSATVWIAETEKRHRMRSEVGLCLKPDTSCLEVNLNFRNDGELPQSFLYWANAAVHANEQYQVIFPPDVYYAIHHAKDAACSWPKFDGKYKGIKFDHADISWWKVHPAPASFFCGKSKENFFGGYDHAAQGGFVHVADRHIAPGKKQWTWGNHPFGYAWDRELTDDSGPYIELMAGVYTDNQPDFTYLMPYETKTFSQYWWPYQKIGVPQNANREAAVRFAEGEIGVAVSRPMKGANIRVMRGGKVVKEIEVDLSPERPWIAGENAKQQAYDSKAGDVLVVLDGGNEVIRCELATKKKQRKLEQVKDKRPVATEPPAPKDIASTDELFLTAEHLDQYRHPTRAPEAYLDELLRRDPGDCRAHILYGKRLLSRGLFEEAREHFAAAVARLTFRHPNPYTGEAHYYLGLALDFLGKDDAAYDAYYKATWDGAWKSPAETRLEMIDMRRGKISRLTSHVACQEKGLSLSSPDMALDAAYDLIEMGQKDEARELLERYLKEGTRAAGESDLMLKYMTEATQKISDTDLNTVKEIMLKQAEDNNRENGHWMNVLTEWTAEDIDLQTNYAETVKGVTTQKVQNFIKQIISAGNHASIVMMPEK